MGIQSDVLTKEPLELMALDSIHEFNFRVDHFVDLLYIINFVPKYFVVTS